MARRRLFVDLSPLRRFPQFRRLWVGYLVGTLGNQLTTVAIPFEVFALTRSSLDVGLVSLAQLGPLLAGTVFGGSLADVIDRRRLLLCTQVALAACTAGLAVDTTFARPALWPLYVVSALAAGVSGVDTPTRAALSVSLVDRDTLVAATALWQLLLGAGAVVGPAVAGLVIGHVGVDVALWIDLGTFAVSLTSVAGLAASGPAATDTRFGPGAILEGFRYLRGPAAQAMRGTFVADLDAMIFGLPRALFPAIGLVRLHGGATAVGLLYAAPGAGALVGALLTGWVTQVRRQGRAVLVAVALWGLAIVAFGLVHLLWVALVLLAVAGAADIVSAVFRGSMLQHLAPDALRGRLSAVHTAVVTGGPRLGDVEAGAVAALAGVEFSVVSGGLACLVGVAVIALRMPRFAAFRVGDAPAPPQAEPPPTVPPLG